MTWPTDHPFWSYRLAKFEMAREKRGLGRLKFANFEKELDARLAALRPALASPRTIFRDITPGRVRLRPKSVEMAPRDDATQSFVRVPERPADHEIQNLGVRVMIEATPEFSTSEAVWIRAYGALLETMLTPSCRGNRLYLRGMPPSIYSQGRRLFEYWAPAYAEFRSDALAAAKSALISGRRRCYLIALDLTSYYDNIDPTFLLNADFIADIEDAAKRHGQSYSSNEYVSATTGLLEAFSRFRREVRRVVGIESKIGIPIGCLTSRLIANLALAKLDRRTAMDPSVSFYGRYVDDIILVMDPGRTDITAALAVIERSLPVDRNRSTDKKIVLDESLLQRPGSSFAVQHRKLRIFDLKGEEGLEYLGAVAEELNRASSERRRFLEPADDAADRAVAASSNVEPITALRDADALSLRRLAANTICAKVVTSAAMLAREEAALYSREHLGVAGRLATDWSRWVEMIDVALHVLAAALTSGDIETVDEVISALLERVGGLRNDRSATLRWGSRTLKQDRASRLIERWVLAQLRETLAAAIPLDGTTVLIDKLLAGALGRVNDKLFTRRKLTAAAHRLATTDLRLVDRETDHDLGTVPRGRRTAVLRALTSELGQAPSFTERHSLLKKFIDVCQSISDPVFFHLDPLDVLLMYRPPSYSDILIRWLRAERPLDGLADIINAVRGTRYGGSPMLDVGGTIVVEPASGMTSGPSGVGSTRVVLGNLCTEDSWWLASLSVPARTRERQRRLARVLNKALYAARRSLRKGIPAILVLPELSLPQQWLREVIRHLSFKAPYLSIIAGLEYNVVLKTVYNEAVCFVPRTFATAAAWIWTKGRAAHEEGPLLVKNGFKFGTRGEARRFAVMSTEHGRFVPLICSELLEVDSRARLLDRVDIVMVPAWNKDLLTFEYFVHAASLDLHSFVAIANNGIYSDCRVRAPYEDHWRRDACRLSSRGENEIVAADLPVDLLRDFRANPNAYKEKMVAWKARHPKSEHDKCPWPGWKPSPPK